MYTLPRRDIVWSGVSGLQTFRKISVGLREGRKPRIVESYDPLCVESEPLAKLVCLEASGPVMTSL